MASYGLRVLLIVLMVQTCSVYVHGEVIKSSLTFVVDETASMWEEIRRLKEEVDTIFEKVSSSKASQIENFVLVTFNDPDAELRTITKDKDEFKRALADIAPVLVRGNFDCPEHAMTGIQVALNNSLPLSYLYVFTDASAKDYSMFEQVKSMAQEKQSQVVFILTGLCGSTSHAAYQVYHQLAQATGGQVFQIMKDDVKDILKHVGESITARRVQIVNRKYPAGNHKVKFNVDAHTEDVLISLTGLRAKIVVVTGPAGSKPPTDPIVSGNDNMAVKKLSVLTPGDYEVEIEGLEEVHIIVIAKTDVHFQYGFSVYHTTAMEDTVTIPPPERVYLSIRLLGKEVELSAAKILDLNDNVIADLSLAQLSKTEQFYVSRFSFDPPTTMFLVTVIGKDLKTGTPVIRTAPTPIARQKPLLEPAVATAPRIEGPAKIVARYDMSFPLKMNVHGYPVPYISWSEKDTGIVCPSKEHLVKYPYDYFSILDIENATKNISYIITAENSRGSSVKRVDVEIRTKPGNLFHGINQ